MAVLGMTPKYKIVTLLYGKLFLFTTVSTLNHKNFELQVNPNQDKMTNYLSTVICSTDMKFANIYFDKQFEGRILDGIIGESSGCGYPSMKIIAYKRGDNSISPSTTGGARLLILLVRELEFRGSEFQMLFRIRQKHIFNLFYLIVSELKLSADHENLLKLMYMNYNILNAVLVAMENGNLEPSVITYNPFNNETIRIPNNVYKKDDLFVKKTSNIFGNPINMVMYKDLVSTLTRFQESKMINFNYDAFLPDLISSAMNATLVLKNPFTKDSKIEDMTAADLTLNGRSYSIDAVIEAGIEETITVRRDDICIFLPFNRIRNTFDIMYRTVDPFVWMLMVVVVFLTWLSLFLIRWSQRCNTCKHIFLLDLFGFHINQALPHMPKKGASRLIIASCLAYCLVIKSIFEGLMYTSMVKTKDARISTIDELLKMNEHDIVVSDIFYNYSEYFLNMSPIKGRFKVINFMEYVQRVDSNEIHYAYVARMRGAKFFENINIVEGLPVFYTIEECIVPHMTLYFARRGSPFLNRINQLLRISEESGIFHYWERQLNNNYDKVKRFKPLFRHHSAKTLENLGFAFQMWSYGLLIASAVFIVERSSLKFNEHIKKLKIKFQF